MSFFDYSPNEDHQEEVYVSKAAYQHYGTKKAVDLLDDQSVFSINDDTSRNISATFTTKKTLESDSRC